MSNEWGRDSVLSTHTSALFMNDQRFPTSPDTPAAPPPAVRPSQPPLKKPVQFMKGVGPRRAEQLARLGIHPDMEPVEEEDETARILPIYNKTTEMTVPAMRRLVHSAVAEYADLVPNGVPPEICARLGLMDLSAALRHLHLPSLDADLVALNNATSQAHRAVVFDELFYLQLGMALRRRQMVKEDGLSIVPGPLVRHLHE